jgi:hypothetical protein
MLGKAHAVEIIGYHSCGVRLFSSVCAFCVCRPLLLIDILMAC